MARDATLALRVDPALKAAIEKAAAEDGRTMSQYVERLLIAHLAQKGHLPKR